MNEKQQIRIWAQMSNAIFWLVPLVVTLFYLRVYKENPLIKEIYLFLVVTHTSVGASYQFRCLSREIVRLEEKIEELERRTPWKTQKKVARNHKRGHCSAFAYELGHGSAVSLQISRAIALLKNKQNGQ